jgi:O-acetyl-ADP-ribose deacetylase (regulator of RNase III)
MIKFKSGNIFQEEVEAIVNTVNCVGVMGRGLALQFKKKFPDNFKSYKQACKTNSIKLGSVFVYDTGQIIGPKYIINFPTKNHWRENSKLSEIDRGLDSLKDFIIEQKIRSISIPPLGCGLGGLDWEDVKSLITQKFSDLHNTDVIVFEPRIIDSFEIQDDKIPKMTSGRAALVVLMNQYLNALLDPMITLLEVHKLMYFMQEAGEDLKLQYKKAIYGPYAENLRHVFKALEGHMITGYGDGGDDPTKELQLKTNTLKEANLFLSNQSSTRERFTKVKHLVEGFETPFGLELLSTVHWLVKNESINNLDSLITSVYSWNESKKKFSTNQIKLAFSRLIEQGWIQ